MRARAVVTLLASFAVAAHAEDRAPATREASQPAHLAQSFVQYGLAFAGEFVAAPGPICTGMSPSGCILGDGGGLVLRVGRRLRSPFYFGGAYEFAKMDSAQLYRVAILQQLRAEGRYYFSTGYAVEPYVMGAAGAVAYGNLWGIDTAGPALGLGVGAEFQLSTYLVVGLSVTYRPMLLAQFRDSSANGAATAPCSVDPACHPTGVAHVFGVELVLETREPF